MNAQQIDVHPFTDKGSREYQEDFFYTDPVTARPWMAVVADGMGGHAGGDIASCEGVKAIKTAFYAAKEGRLPIAEALANAVTEGHEAVIQEAIKANATGNMGSTVVAFVIEEGVLRWCSAGDSRLYHCRDGKVVQLSRDFTIEQDMRQGIERGEWTEEDVLNSPQRKALTSFMGTDHWRHDDGSTPLSDGDIIVACSDGVYGTIEMDGIEAACGVAPGATADRIAQDMLRRIREAGKSNQDNSTAVVVRYAAEVAAPVSAAADERQGSKGMKAGAIAAVAAVVLIGGFALRPMMSGKTDDAAPAATAPKVAAVPSPAAPRPAPPPIAAAAPAPTASPTAPAPTPAPVEPSLAAPLKLLEEDLDSRRVTPADARTILAFLRRTSSERETPELAARYQALAARIGPGDGAVSEAVKAPDGKAAQAKARAVEAKAAQAKAADAKAAKAAADAKAKLEAKAKAAEKKAPIKGKPNEGKPAAKLAEGNPAPSVDGPSAVPAPVLQPAQPASPSRAPRDPQSPSPPTNGPGTSAVESPARPLAVVSYGSVPIVERSAPPRPSTGVVGTGSR